MTSGGPGEIEPRGVHLRATGTDSAFHAFRRILRQREGFAVDEGVAGVMRDAVRGIASGGSSCSKPRGPRAVRRRRDPARAWRSGSHRPRRPRYSSKSSTDSLSSSSIGASPKPRPSIRMEADLVVVLPRNVVGRTDVDVARVEPLVELRLDGFGLRDLLRLEPLAFEHVEEVGVAAGVELIGAIDAHAPVGKEPRQRAMDDGRSNLALDVVADDRQAARRGICRPIRGRRRGRPARN